MRFNKILLSLFTLILFSVSIKASVCACCAEPGTYSISTKKLAKYELEELKKIRFADANLFTDAGFPETVKGLSSVGEDYFLSSSFQNRLWSFNFRDETGKTGTLALSAPASMVTFMADIHDRQPGAGEPFLYKEWRFKYRVRHSTGIFQKGAAPLTEYFLVLQGRGNNCTSATDFKNWRLEITGKKANYAFYGNLRTIE